MHRIGCVFMVVLLAPGQGKWAAKPRHHAGRTFGPRARCAPAARRAIATAERFGSNGSGTFAHAAVARRLSGHAEARRPGHDHGRAERRHWLEVEAPGPDGQPVRGFVSKRYVELDAAN
jgi:hypothetical protein